ncbi:MAG: ABC transporter permease [Candidatus Aminicenantes bacterium]|nr:ABC transporter permease [Candidatus Aminicenantes bacterium]
MIKHLNRYRLNHAIIEDTRESFDRITREKSIRYARLWYWGQCLDAVLKNTTFDFRWSLTMLKNHIKIALRNIRRQKASSFLNITGLALGIAGSLLIFLWVQDEMSFDRFHTKADRIHRVVVSGVVNDTEIAYTLNPLVLGETLVNDFPEVEKAVRIYRPRQGVNVRYQDKLFMESRILYVERNFFDVFSFPLIAGNPQSVLEDTTSVILTESTARKYFGKEDPVGKNLTFGSRDLKVTGVTADVPQNSHFTFDILRPLHVINLDQPAQWMNNFVLTYLVLKEGSLPQQMEAKFPALIKNKIGNLGEGNSWNYHLQALTDIHLQSHIDYELGENGNILYVSIFSIIALFIILIACINFINLTSARASTRAKEVGIRKVAGSQRFQLIRQFLCESLLQSVIASIAAMGIVAAVLPAFRNLVGKSITFEQLLQPHLLGLIAGLTLLIGIVSGSYPAFLLSSFHPASVLKRDVFRRGKKSILRNGLVVFQFGISVFLIIGTVIVFKQLEFIRSKNLGFDRDHVLVIKNPSLLGNNLEVFKQALLAQPQILSSGVSSHLPGCDTNFVGIGFKPDGGPWLSLETWNSDEDLLDTLQMEMSQGRFFSREFPSDNRAIVLNEAAVDLIGWDEPLGRTLRSMDEDWTVIGVIKNINYQSLRYNIRPMGLFHFSSGFNNYPQHYLSVRIKPGDVSAPIAGLKTLWDQTAKGYPFEYTFLDEDYASLYNNEQKTGKLVLIFSLMSVFIASLGLFGLTSFTAVQRTKEVGIRKVLGASVSGITTLLIRDFLFLVVIANIIAIPSAYYIMTNWLNNFAYHTNMVWWIFVLSSFFSLTIALLTVGFRTIKAAVANPIESLRYE